MKVEYTLETYAPLLTEEFGGWEVYGEEVKGLQKMLGVKTADEITLTTSEDGDLDYYKVCADLSEKLGNTEQIEEMELSGELYRLYEMEGIKIVMATYPFVMFFIRVADKEKFESIMEKY